MGDGEWLPLHHLGFSSLPLSIAIKPSLPLLTHFLGFALPTHSLQGTVSEQPCGASLPAGLNPPQAQL